MAFTYDITQLATSKMMQVRLALGDTDVKAPVNKVLQDEEINFRLTEVGQDVLHASVKAGDDLIARWAHREVGTVQASQSQRYEWLVKRVAELRRQMLTHTALDSTAQSQAEKDAAALDTDRIQPAFQREMMDNPMTGNNDPLDRNGV